MTFNDGTAELERRQRLATWVAREVIPHELAVRAWLGRSRLLAEDVDEIVQEAYCRLAVLERVDHIDRPAAYFFSIARNLLLRRLKRDKIVPIIAAAEIESTWICDAPSPEREAGSKRDYARLMALIAKLPELNGKIVKMRKIEGLSQREIAQRLGVTEAVVEKRVWQSIRVIQAQWRAADESAAERFAALGHLGASR